MYTLLIVDDDPAIVSLLTCSFRKSYQIISALNGIEAITILNKQPIDLIICDQEIPDVNGMEVLSYALKVQPDAIRILLTGGYIHVDDLLKYINEVNIYKYFKKPWSQADLKLSVARALESLDLKRDLREARDLFESACKDAVVMLCLAAEGKDQDTASHLHRVQNYTEALAIAMGISKKEAEHMGLMSMLHDIGKLAVPDEILKKPGKLTDEEWAIMREHPMAGVRILSSNPFYEVAREVSAGHHENFDGTGYPNNLGGEDIPLSARIVKLADVFDALTTTRPYKEPWTMEAAVDHIESFSGSMFDPTVVAKFKMLYLNGTLERIKLSA